MAKINFEVRYASHPEDVKHYDTERLRKEFLIEKIFGEDEINMVYTLIGRMVVGGAMPVKESLTLTAPAEIRAQYFTERREVAVVNVGGAGRVIVGEEVFEIGYKEGLYISRGNRHITFESLSEDAPALFYFNSAPAHKESFNKKVTKESEGVVVMHLGSLEESNERTINRILVSEAVPCCQLQLGMTELNPGSTWNTMPAHTHDRRMEAYFYFDIPETDAVCHFMGQPQETRHIWMHNHQAVISPEWSIHSACATRNYTFIWGMCGENNDYGDMDVCKTTDLR